MHACTLSFGVVLSGFAASLSAAKGGYADAKCIEGANSTRSRLAPMGVSVR